MSGNYALNFPISSIILILTALSLCVLLSHHHVRAAPATYTLPNPDSSNPSQTLSQWAGIRQASSQPRDATGFETRAIAPTKTLLMINGTADDAFTATFYPQDGKTAADYDFVFLSNNSEIINPKTDISLAQSESSSLVNLTAAIDFNKFPGLVQVTMEARNVADGSLYNSVSVDYLAAGMAVYTADSRTLISGAGRSFRIPSYEDIYKKTHWDFGVFVQYLNGSNSLEILENPAPINDFTLADIKISFLSYTGQILWDSKSCLIADGEWNGDQVSLTPGCGAGFAVGYVNDTYYDGFHFALDFEKNRAGRLDIFFEWDQFTVGASTEFEGEEYTNYVLAEIGGVPPAVVRLIEPGNPFDKNGGEEIFVEMFNTADVNVTSFDVNDIPFPLIPGSKSIISGPDDFYETARFYTQPGTGKRLPWTISGTRAAHDIAGNEYKENVPFVDDTGFLFSYDDEDIWVSNLQPNVVPESGGVSGVLTGKFGIYDADDSTQTILIGNIPLNKSTIISWAADKIIFQIPRRIDIGSAWTYGVVVQKGNSYSAPQTLRYEPSSLRVKQQVFGASSDFDTGVYTVSHCGNSTYVVYLEDYGGEEGIYNWKILNSSNDDLLLLENATLLVKTIDTLQLPNIYLPHYDETYKLVADITVGNLSTSSLFLVRRTIGVVVGVTLVQPENRTISYPQVNMRVVAKIEIPECYEDVPQLNYEWEYENKSRTLLEAERFGVLPTSVHDTALKPEFDKYVHSPNSNSSSTGNSITTTRLGRELYVNRNYLKGGVHRIRLTVHAAKKTGRVKLFGAAGTSVHIHESPLKAIIGSGQSSRKASDAEDFYVSGQGSFDPDVVSGANPSNGLAYEWGCQFSRFMNYSWPEICHTDLLPLDAQNSSIFKVKTESLQKHSNRTLEEDEGQVYLRYTLTVRKEGREGSVTQDVALVQSNGRALASYDRIEITNSQGVAVDCDVVQFWDDIILSPITSSATEWRFRLDYPASEKSQFLAGNTKLIARPGYYTSTGTSAPGFQRLPLGIKADMLAPHQEYIFSIMLQEPGKISEEVRLCLKTVEVPQLIFPTIQTSKGTVDTIFRATATTTFRGHSLFSFQFYLIEIGKKTREYCVDGCTGANIARFQVAKPGVYTLQCRLLASNGKTLLEVKNNTALIEIQSSSSVTLVDQFDKEMDKDFNFGDDGAVNQKGFFVTQSMHEEDNKVVAMSDDLTDESCANYTRKWAKMSRTIIHHELPNTANTRNYVSLASNFARLKCVEESETLYELLGIVDDSITRTPQEETLTTVTFSKLEEKPVMELEEDLLRFYNFSMTRAVSSLAGGSLRGRLVPVVGAVNNLVLDLSEMWMKHLTATATSGRICGWDATYNSNTIDGEPDQSIRPQRSVASLGVNTIRVAVMCNKEQGSSLSTPFASFSWCDSIYQTPGSQRKLITIAESFDYPFLSGVQGLNRSDSTRLVMVDITTLGEKNKLVSAMSDSTVMAQTESDSLGEDLSSCYRIGLTMGEEAMTRSDDCSTNVPYHMWPRKKYGEQIAEPFQSNIYQRRTTGVKVTPETRNDSRSVIAVSNLLGLYGAHRTRCSNDLLGGGDSLAGQGFALGGILLGILLTLLVMIGLVYALVSSLFAAAAPDDDQMMIENFVERDFFGRGEVRLNLAHDDVSVSSSEASSENEISVGTMEDLEDALEELEGNIPDHDSLLAATQSDLPERPPS